jgi:hypothetical protein
MSEMLAVRFPIAMIAAVRRFARHDGKTVSGWVRDLVAAELKNPQRQRSVDFSEYPQTKTGSSGAETVRVQIDVRPDQASWTA